MNIEWNAENYSANFSFVHEHGKALLNLIDTKTARTALDLGCGSGALTKQIYDMGLTIKGMDASEHMLSFARERYPEIEFLRGDAADFKLDNKVDLVFSNAVFHWIDREKQPQMLRCIYNVLNDGGQLVAEFGGKGNALLIHTALRSAFEKRGMTYNMSNYFPSAEEYRLLLEQAGFKVEFISLFDRFTELKGDNGLSDWIEMFRKESFKNIDSQLKADIIGEVVDELRPKLYKDEKWYADYVRLRFKALK